MVDVNVSLTPITVKVSGEATPVTLKVAAGPATVSLGVSGGIGPAAVYDTAITQLVGVNPIAAGKNVSISTASGSITISAADPPVVSVQGRTGAVAVTLADLTAAAAVHTHTTTQITGLSYPVTSVQGRTGAVSLTVADITAAPATHTHDISYPVSSVQGRTGTVTLTVADLTAAAASHTHSTSQITGLSYPVLSVQGRTGTVTLTIADLTAAAASHTHSTSQIADLSYPVLSVQGRTGAVVLTSQDVTAAAASHTHSTSQITDLSYPVLSVQGVTGAVSIVGGANVTVSTAGSAITIAGGDGLPPQGGSVFKLLTTDGTAAAWYSLLGGVGATVTQSTASKSFSVSAAGGGGLTWVSVPSLPTSPGSVGQAAYDSSHVYFAVATDSWIRVLRASWVLPPGAPSVSAYASAGSPDWFGSPWSSGASSGEVTVSWAAPASDGGAAVTSYVVRLEFMGSASPLTVTISAEPGIPLNHTFTGLPWVAYQCRSFVASVRAINSAGQGPAGTTTAYLPSVAAPVLHVAAEPTYGNSETSFSLRWVPVCGGNGGLVANGVGVTDPFTHYELQAVDRGGIYAGADGSGSYYGWKNLTGTVTPTPVNAGSSVIAGASGSLFLDVVTAATLVSNAGYFTPYNTGLRFRVRTVRVVDSAVVAAGTWSNIVEANWQ